MIHLEGFIWKVCVAVYTETWRVCLKWRKDVWTEPRSIIDNAKIYLFFTKVMYIPSTTEKKIFAFIWFQQTIQQDNYFQNRINGELLIFCEIVIEQWTLVMLCWKNLFHFRKFSLIVTLTLWSQIHIKIRFSYWT